jgi:type IV secretory pathway TraG/TraD family ATPase VirD4
MILIVIQTAVFGYWTIYEGIVTSVWDGIEFFSYLISEYSIDGDIVNAWLRLFCGIVVIPFFAFIYFFSFRAEQTSEKYIRGARLTSIEDLYREMRRHKEVVDLPMGSVEMPVSLENRHTFIVGKPGTGKTTFFDPIIIRLYERKEKGIILDTKGDYIPKHYREETDIIFNPLDIRGAGWNFFNEMEIYPDVNVNANSLIPDPKEEKSRFWNDGARAVFAGISHHLWQQNRRTNKDLWQTLIEPADMILEKLKNTVGGEASVRYLAPDKKGSRQADLLSTLMQYTAAFEYMADIDGKFKIGDWLTNGRPGFIYITNYKKLASTLRPILSLFIDLLSLRLLSMPDDLNRRVFFLLDEFGSLQKLSSIVDLLTEGRSKGACVFLATQDIGKVKSIYGPDLLESIENACGNRVTLALSGAAAKREAELNIGELELQRKNRSSNIGTKESRTGTNFAERKDRELLMLPSDISNLRDLTGIVRFRNYDFVASKWKWFPLKKRCESFILRPGLSLKEIKAEADAKAKADAEAKAL